MFKFIFTPLIVGAIFLMIPLRLTCAYVIIIINSSMATNIDYRRLTAIAVIIALTMQTILTVIIIVIDQYHCHHHCCHRHRRCQA